ncbi:MAG TPA: O-antigen ligase family protein [Gemmatimonadaceae bacterium]
MQPRIAQLLLQLGLLAVVLAVLPYKLFELDRYFVPKELVLHAVALLALLTLLPRLRQNRVDAADALLALFLVLSLASSLFATNHWLAQRALGVSVSSAIVFWTARTIGAAGSYRPLLVAASVAVVVAAVTSLAQAYGLETVYFSLNRAPGGTFGNRNFVAHFSAIGLPAMIYVLATARRPSGELLGSFAFAIVAATLVLSRSRAAWLAIIASLLVLALLLLVSRRRWAGQQVGGRLARLALAALLGASVAIVLPNDLNWRSDSPYLDSARGMVDYRSGSGRGRVAQYANSLEMAVAQPVLGVGPGNWAVHYPSYAPRNDRSLTDDGMTANPWPSSDWIAYLSERGLIAGLSLLGVFAALFVGALRRWHDAIPTDDLLAKIALAGTITATLVVSAFDAVLLLAAPAFLAWTVIGATSGIGRAGRWVVLSRAQRLTGAGLVLLVLLASVARSATQVVAITTVGAGGTRAGWNAAAAWDPGSYRINLRVAELHAARRRCAAALPYARKALDLFPDAPAARRVVRRCS